MCLAAATAKSEQAVPATQWLRVDGVDISLHDVIGNGNWHQINHGNHVGTVNALLQLLSCACFEQRSFPLLISTFYCK